MTATLIATNTARILPMEPFKPALVGAGAAVIAYSTNGAACLTGAWAVFADANGHTRTSIVTKQQFDADDNQGESEFACLARMLNEHAQPYTGPIEEALADSLDTAAGIRPGSITRQLHTLRGMSTNGARS